MDSFQFDSFTVSPAFRTRFRQDLQHVLGSKSAELNVSYLLNTLFFSNRFLIYNLEKLVNIAITMKYTIISELKK